MQRLTVTQPVRNQQRACEDNTEKQGITEPGHRLCNRRIGSEDCECHCKKYDQAAYIEKSRAAQEHECFCAEHFCDVHRDKVVFAENRQCASLLTHLEQRAV